MGLFAPSPQEENTWTALPGEPRETRDTADTLDAAPAVDPLALDFGTQVTSIVFPVAPPTPEAASVDTQEPKDRPEGKAS